MFEYFPPSQLSQYSVISMLPGIQLEFNICLLSKGMTDKYQSSSVYRVYKLPTGGLQVKKKHKYRNLGCTDTSYCMKIFNLFSVFLRNNMLQMSLKTDFQIF